ncbi:hypothetical protein MYCTH_2299174 [Thermothelomyces thermophilus ATCC 42464]|uniref:Required for respiratory growth protein 7, mitochondrial n=1 Tax=Thermothelomyces thermophilus (strain ATCC 42464 / BCRC 31852 / DSM 1799) TaxID=573729 RepID=G2Q4V8_THET4|nr:uncharacterized protein MYCTH_2299174 [Thermothelomyces thermophilus ATCC 42464]AEO55397.1 hypothetical protein MYCTH_2299174 [Thermothelomyces thermophilus ATCC 42464]
MRASLLRPVGSLQSPPSILFRAFSSAHLPRLHPDSSSAAEPQQSVQQEQQQRPPSPPLIYPSAPSPHHTDLPSFLAHAARTNLDPSSTVYVGTHFEYTVAGALARFGLSLRRVGGASDCGIDLLGTWSLPPFSAEQQQQQQQRQQQLRVLAQCKAVQRPGPHLVRELEGAFVGAPAGWRAAADRRGVLGLLVTERPATRGIREALARSRWPMGYVACSREGVVGQFLWNQMAQEEGLEGFGVGMRHGGARGKELVLTWKGRYLSPGGSNQGAG